MILRVAVVLGLIATFIAPSRALAQPLADRVPADALAYVGWAGTEKLGSAYSSSHLNAVMSAPQMQQFFRDTEKTFTMLLANDNPSAVIGVSIFKQLASIVWRRPCAMYLGSGVWNDGPRLVLMCRPGDDEAMLIAQLKAVLSNVDTDIAIRLTRIDDLIVLSVGYQADEKTAVNSDSSLLSDVDFQRSLQKVQRGPACVMYVNGQRILTTAHQTVKRSANKQLMQQWKVVRTQFGLTSFRRFIWAGGFLGRNWGSSTWTEVLPPFEGLATQYSTRSLPKGFLKLAPRDATWVSASTFDVSQAYGFVESLLRAADKESAQRFSEGVWKFAAETGVNPPEFLGALGTDWLVYSNAGNVSSEKSDMVVVNRVRDMGVIELALLKAQTKLMRRDRASGQARQFHLAVNQVDGVNVNMITQFNVGTFCWAIQGEYFFATSRFEGMEWALAQIKGQRGSILDNPKFAGLKKKAQTLNLRSIGFTDLPKTSRGVEAGMAKLLTPANQALSMVPGVPPLQALPFKPVRKHLSIAIDLSWTDPDGFHSRSVSPFPGAGIFSPQSTWAGFSEMGTAISVPAIARVDIKRSDLARDSDPPVVTPPQPLKPDPLAAPQLRQIVQEQAALTPKVEVDSATQTMRDLEETTAILDAIELVENEATQNTEMTLPLPLSWMIGIGVAVVAMLLIILILVNNSGGAVPAGQQANWPGERW